MKIRYLYIYIFLFIASTLQAQETFSDETLEKFVTVYMTFKSEKKRNDQVDKIHFDKYGVSPARYKEIFTRGLNDQSIELSDNEKKLIAEIKNQNDKIQLINNELVKQLCTNHTIDPTAYTLILDRFKTDQKFQRSLKPQFDAYLKRLR